MPDFSTVLRDFGTVPTIICAAFIVLIVYSIIKGGGGKGKGNGKSSGTGGTTPSNPT